MKKLSILGSTGSIGKNTLEVVSEHPGEFQVAALAVYNNVTLLESQIHEFKPRLVAVYDEAAAGELRKKNLPVEVLSGPDGLNEVAGFEDADTVVSAVVGSDGLLPTLAAIRAGKEVALANKEALVMAGKIVMSEASRRGVRILPVDSEHSAVFQCLEGRSMDDVRKIILTASGGAFLRKDMQELESVTPADALKHPNWDMGRKITVDSATLMNKGLEVIEAFWLFNVPVEKIGVIIHPQSIVHSMVSFVDGSMIAQLSIPDMKGPIGYALSWPRRLPDVLPSLDLSEMKDLTFEEPDSTRFPSLELTFDALRTGGTMPCVLNAANETAVDAFLGERIPFTGITKIVAAVMDAHEPSNGETIEEVIDASDRAKKKADEIIASSW